RIELEFLLFADLQHGEERLLRNVHLADPLHALLALFLLFEQLALAADVATVALGDDVLADGGDGLAGDDLRADGRLNSHLEHLPRNQFTHLRDQGLAAVVSEVAMNDDRECIHRITADENVHLHHGRDPGAGENIIERSIAARDGFQAVIEIEDDLIERKLVGKQNTGGADIFKILLASALVLDQLENAADVLFVGQDLGDDDRLFNGLDL